MMFAHLDDAQYGQNNFEPKNFVFTLKLLGVFEVGRKPDGSRMIAPEGLMKFENLMKALG